jgi:hypothetical protein
VVRYDGEPSVLLSIEMQKGKNIVQLGDSLGIVFERLAALLPPDIHVDPIANQPAVVRTRIADLSREFLLAIGAVILVTIILLPLSRGHHRGGGHSGHRLTSLGVLERHRHSVEPGFDRRPDHGARHRGGRRHRHRR